MIEGYSSLNTNIDKTIELISDVSSASREQQTGIVQINDAINSLDQKTKKNAQIAGLANKITFINGDVTETKTLESVPDVDSAFIDPDWAVSGVNHVFRFLNSNTNPPSDKLLELINKKTPNITLVQPPGIDKKEFENLLPHECEYLYLNNQHELYCLHFGRLRKFVGESKFDIRDI